MNNRRILFFILIGFTILMITTGIVISNLGDSEQNYTEDIASMEKQLEHLQNIQIKANSIVMKDDKVQELIEGKNHLKMIEIIHNKSYVEEYYWIGFEYKNLSEFKNLSENKGFQMIGGNIYRLSIDLSNKKIISVEDVKNRNLRVKQTSDEVFLKDEYTSIYSLVSLRTGNVWSPLENIWYHSFGINGTGEVRLVPDPPSKAKGWGCFKHYVTIKEVYNKENYFFDENKNEPEDKKVWCSGNKLPQIKSESNIEDLTYTCVASYPPENSVWNIINPGNWPSDAGFFYRWKVILKQNQTIIFDVNVKFESIEDARNIDETNHYWRVIITSPPDPRRLSVTQMKEYGISGYEAIHHIGMNGYTHAQVTCSYFHNSGIILLKEEFINEMAGE